MEEEKNIINEEELQEVIAGAIPEEQAAEEQTSLEEEEQPLEEDAPAQEPEPAKEQSAQTAIAKIKEFTEEDEDKEPATLSLRKILGGDFLSAGFVRKQLLLIILIFACFFVHISYRYINQKELIEIDKAKQNLDNVRFNMLTRFSELTAISRQTYLEKKLKESKDSTLETSTNPPYIIYLNGEESELPEEETNDTIKHKP